MRVFPYLLLGLAAATGCSAGSSSRPGAHDSYEAALARTARGGTIEKGSPQEQEAVHRFIEFYKEFSHQRIQSQVRELYADDAYFRDPFKEVQGIDAVEAYFLRSTEGVERCTFDIRDWAHHDGNYYFRWTMTLVLKRFGAGSPILGVGMTHVRFDPQGKIVFHQDYWDAASTVYERLPVIGWVLRRIRGRM
jgi:limonene-1,2-epoxide hydrolase